MEVSELIDIVAQNPTKVSAQSGVSRMTIKRIKDGTVHPSLSTLKELALSVGKDVELSVIPASDGDAAVAARHILAGEHPIDNLPTGVRKWIERLNRRMFNTPRELAQWSGLMSAPQHRKHAEHFSPRAGFTQERIAQVLASAAHPSGKYLISGGAAATMWTNTPQSAPTVLWIPTTESDNARELIDEVSERISQTLTRAEHFQPAGVVLAQAPQEILHDSHTHKNLHYAAPLQVVIDLYGLNADRTAFNMSEDW